MKNIVIVIIVCCCCALTGKANPKSVSDSLLQQYQTLPHDTARLSILNKIIKIEQNNIKCIQYSDTLLKEALALKDDKYASLAAYYHLIYYYNHCERDSVAKWITLMEPFVQKSGLWDYFFDAKRFQIDLFTYKEQYELAIYEANKMKNQALKMNNSRGVVAAYQCLSNAFIGSQRWDEGVKSLEDAYRLLKNEENPVVRISVLTQLVSVTKEMKDSAKQLKYLQELESVLKKFIKENPSMKEGFYDVFIFNELFYAQYYLHTNQPQKAYQRLEQSRKYLTANTYFMYKVLYFDAYASYYQQIKKYQKASDYIDTTLNMLKPDFMTDYAEQLLKKGRIWVEAGNSEKALPFYQHALSIKDSAAIALSNTQMNQIKDNYNLGRIEMEQNRQNIRITSICLIVILCILIALFVVMYRTSLVRKALKHSEKEIRKSALLVRNSNEMKNRFLSNMSYNIRTPLNNVVGFSQLIANEPEMDEEMRSEYSQIIHRSSDYLLKLVNDVLDLSRLEARMMKFQIQSYDVVALCNDACYMARMKNENTGIQVEFISDIESQEITTDTGRLTQALLSTLIYPQECHKERTIQFTLSKEENILYFYISNSALADPAFTSQETYIRNDINRLLLEYFGGQYQVNTQTPDGPEIVFSYPIDYKPE